MSVHRAIQERVRLDADAVIMHANRLRVLRAQERAIVTLMRGHAEPPLARLLDELSDTLSMHMQDELANVLMTVQTPAP